MKPALLEKDLKIKILSVFLASLLWFFVMDSANPTTAIDLSVPLKVLNEEKLQGKGIYVKNREFPRNVSVSIKGRRDKVISVNANDIEAVLDLSKVNDVNSKSLYIEAYMNKEGVLFEGVTPRVVNLDLDKLGNMPFFKIEVDTVGKLKENYKIINMRSEPETVSINAAEAKTKNVGSIKVFVDVNNLSKDLNIKKTCKIYNQSGIEIIDSDININANVNIEVAKEVNIIPNVKGKPSEGFIDGLRSVKPEKALITGNSSLLDNIYELKTEQVDIANASEDIYVNRALIVPEGVKLYNTPSNVTMFVGIEKLASKEFIYTEKEISIINDNKDSFKYEIPASEFKIKVLGNKEEIEKLDKANLNPSVDVKALKMGKNNVPLKITLPGTVKLQEEYTVDVKVDKK